MRVLVFGAGVIGCELAHLCYQAGNSVTLLARGAWADVLERRGLVIRHALQMRTTTDRVHVIRQLSPENRYDMIFVVMQQTQVPAVLPTLAANVSPRVVLVGNNMQASACEQEILDACPSKEVAFGCFMAAGHRESERVVSLHLNPKLICGPLDAKTKPLSDAMRERVASAIGAKSMQDEHSMDAYLKCHAVSVLPIVYLCFAHDYDLTKVSFGETREGLAATCEAYRMYRELGIALRPDGEDEALDNECKGLALPMFAVYKTFVGRLVASDHCSNAPGEMWALDEAFEQLRASAEGYTGSFEVWDKLRSAAVARFAEAHPGWKAPTGS